MENVSIRISQDLIIGRLIINVRVIRIRIIYATYTEKFHHSISSDLLARKRGIGLENSNCTLESTMQETLDKN